VTSHHFFCLSSKLKKEKKTQNKIKKNKTKKIKPKEKYNQVQPVIV